MNLTILGSSASQPAAGDASSGYLVEAEGAHVLMDCGSGVIGNLLQHAELSDLDAIVISHMHPDHYIDLIAMRYGIRYGAGRACPIDVYLPPGGEAQLRRVSDAISSTQPFFAGALNLQEYQPGVAVDVGPLTVTPIEVSHGIRSFAMLAESSAGRLAYSSDTVMCEQVERAAGGVDVFLAENTLGGGAPDHHQPRTHLSAVEAGLIAAHAEVSKLVLTHFWHTADRGRARTEAEAVFRGTTVIARPHLSLMVGAHAPTV